MLNSRRYKIFEILIRGVILLCLIALSIRTLANILHYLFDKSDIAAPILPILIVTTGMISLLSLAKRGYSILCSKMFILLLLAAGVYNSIKWGADVPMGYVIYTLVIILAGIIVNSKFAFNILVTICLFLISLSHLQGTEVLKYDGAWLASPPSIVDGIISSITLSIIALVSWISNREIEKSLARAEASEKDLRKERDLLEIRVKKRTEELEKAQQEKILTVYRFADLGRLAAGLMHDIVNPLTVVSLNLERVYDQSAASTSHDLQQLRKATERAITGTQQIEKYVEAARKHIQKQDDQSIFPICAEINRIKNLFSYRCRKEHVSFLSSCEPKIIIKGSSVRLNQCLSNIVANALDAHTTTTKSHKTISINVTENKTHIILEISDNASGISSKTLPYIFDPFFTTKGIEYGTGIGLSMTKNIIEESFHGSISVESDTNTGTTFRIQLPKHQK